MFSAKLFTALLPLHKLRDFSRRHAGSLRFRKRTAVITTHFVRSPEQIVIYPICPRCRLPIPREYQNYCCSCGQALLWETFHPDEDDESF